MPLLALTPYIERHESPHGQGIITYGEDNRERLLEFRHQGAPEPAFPQGRIASRPSRMPIAIMSTRPKDWNSGFANGFIPYARKLTLRIPPAGNTVQREARSMNPLGIRPNIQRPPAATYGSLFYIPSSTYDVIGL